jgi:hypothetical protein
MPIRSAKKLQRLASENRAVVVRGWQKPTPARVIAAMQFGQVLWMIDRRDLYTYRKGEK